MGRKLIPLILLFFLVLSILPLNVKAQETYYFIEVSIGKPYYLRGESVNVTVTTNSTAPNVQIYDPSMTLIYDQMWTENESRLLPVNQSASYGTYTVKGLVINGTCETWFTVLDVSNWTLASFPHVKEHKGLTYIFYSNWTFTVSNAEDILLVDMTKIRELKNQFDLDVTALQNSMNFLVRFTKGEVFAMDLAFSFIHKGCKFIVNGTMDQPRDLTFQFASPKQVMKYLDSLKSGSIVFDWSDLRRIGHIFSYESATKLLTVSLPQSFRLDPYIFEDGFESNDYTAWTGTNGFCEIVESPVHHGTYSANTTGYFYKSFASTDPCYARIYFYALSLPSAGNERILTKLYDVGWGADWTGVFVDNTGGNIHFGLRVPSGDTLDDTQIVVDTWYCLEIMRQVGSGDGEGHLWLDGDLVASATSETIGGNSQNYVVACGQQVSGVYDCAVIDSSYIGVEVIGQDLTFNLYENFNIWDYMSRSLVLSRSTYENIQFLSSSIMNKEKGFSLFDNVLLWGSSSRGIEVGRSIFENIRIYAIAIEQIDLAVLDLYFSLVENVQVYSSALVGRELSHSFFENLRVWASTSTVFEGIAIDLSFTLFETAHAWVSLAEVIVSPYTVNDALLLAGFAVILAFVAIGLVFLVRKES